MNLFYIQKIKAVVFRFVSTSPDTIWVTKKILSELVLMEKKSVCKLQKQSVFYKTKSKTLNIFSLSGQFGSASFCLNGNTITVTFESNNGVVYTGYESSVTATTDMVECENTVDPTTYVKLY